MAKRLAGISNNVIQVRISGARVAFDPRSTVEVERDMTNRKPSKKPKRDSFVQVAKKTA